MKYIVFDMEWNQTYGRERPLPFGRSLTGEIIEIGAVRLSENFKYEDVMKVYVRPRFYRKLHSMVKRLTGITQDVLDDSPDFPEALEIFREFCTDDFVTMTWGDSDMPVLRENIDAWGLPKWEAKNYNLQSIYMKQKGLKNHIALETAALELGIAAENIQYHDAACDAAVTAEISRRIETAKGIEEYVTPLGEFTESDIVGYEKVNGVKDLQKLRSDPRIRFTVCPKCKRPLEAERIIPQSSGKKLARLECADDGKFLLRLRTWRSGDEFNVTKTLYEWNDAVETVYNERLAVADEKKEKFLERVRATGKKPRRRRKKKKPAEAETVQNEEQTVIE